MQNLHDKNEIILQTVTNPLGSRITQKIARELSNNHMLFVTLNHLMKFSHWFRIMSNINESTSDTICKKRTNLCK